MNKTVRIGTRGSKLALWQAEHVAACLQTKGLEPQIVIIDTTGDKILDQSLSKIGSKGLFTEELEEQLHAGTIDIAVHSAKDLQTHLKGGMYILAITERELVNDVLVSHKPIDTLKNNPDLIIGTSSTRRRALLRKFYPQAKMVDMRGNLQTRIRKMEEGACDAMLLAYAGMHRMGYDSLIKEKLSLEEFIPAAGQGTLAIEAASTLDKEKAAVIRAVLNDAATETAVSAERAFLRTLEGGCSIPVFALAVERDTDYLLTGGIVSLDGTKYLRKEIRFTAADAEQRGVELATVLLKDGADEILAEIKKGLSKS
ncbi:hydroxymethylbilane synthase [Cytophaga hutchinsonii]|uniref:Porphobilinogen deaminase n=1 Tax=Cytophaga hutchinsonii (strain ATCC 33406 / DSM 1761 / CIP 103989 / NBRC 15051 / NCIMB 9469 / D465) TaxID=269798 RepID=HEM3_CYTH3|nr:hydroxymethylbilane synthase [Cytophaga hutchinsonii]Q11XT5.1 RecName: Full=Porphobilinogen deaminase; Short=PBG; AltName: Full=Hydroxymethylbilane synthase; Short=HMBS; AltName: Full=Pre-uroporphyrinogen synthase [Cytophaga hutchinsonii ATCC 33406]ABG57781.1 hydroxymethylbilane synthase [Cytophaga hutchinsonii ATCC 33406]SFX05377.1 hydroxymethylbilane synthase [Cytophaga hutchinsonii ATCC 33406]